VRRFISSQVKKRFIFYMKWIDNSSRTDKSVTFEAALSDFFSFVDDLCCLHLLNKVFIMHLIGLQLLLIKVGIKNSSKSRCITLGQKPNSVNVVIKRPRTAAPRGHVKVSWRGIHQRPKTEQEDTRVVQVIAGFVIFLVLW